MQVQMFPKYTFPEFYVATVDDVPAECQALGYIILDFGSGATRSNDATASMTGLPFIKVTSKVELWIQGTDETSENNAYAHLLASHFVTVAAEAITPGLGFTARGICNGEVTGKIKARWAAVWN